jgi:argininosuccinate lyase
MGIALDELSDSDLTSIHPKLTGEVRKNLNALGAIQSRDSINGTSPSSVRKQITELSKQIDNDSQWINGEQKRFSGMMSL